MAEMTEIRDSVRARYAAAAKAAATQESSCGCGSESSESTCCGTEVALTDRAGNQVFGGALYADGEAAGAPTQRCKPRSAVACRPPSPTSTRARRCSTSAPAAAPTC